MFSERGPVYFGLPSVIRFRARGGTLRSGFDRFRVGFGRGGGSLAIGPGCGEATTRIFRVGAQAEYIVESSNSAKTCYSKQNGQT